MATIANSGSGDEPSQLLGKVLEFDLTDLGFPGSMHWPPVRKR